MTIKFARNLALIYVLFSTVGVFQNLALQKSRGTTTEAFKHESKISNSLSQLRLIGQMPSFGYRNVLANWTFLQFLQYFGDDEARNTSGYGNSPDYLSVSIHHDPYFRFFYVFLSGSTTIYAGKPEESVRIMSKGLEDLKAHRAPDNYYIWRYKGTDELLFLNDSKSAQKSFEMAANWASESDSSEANSVAQISHQTAQFLATNPDSKPAQINAWGSILTTALNDGIRNHAIGKIRELGGNVLLSENGQFKIEYPKTKAVSISKQSGVQ